MRSLPVSALLWLLAPVVAQGAAEPPTRPSSRPALADAPHVFHQSDGSVVAKWVVAGKVRERRFAKGEPVTLPRFRDLLGPELTLRQHVPEADTWKMPEKLFVISDVEGEYRLMRGFLAANGVIDAAGKWAYGKGHLVCVGDMVDRGTEVTETLWLIYRLAAEARVAGGHVHYVLGNHEVMLMGGDVRYAAQKYKAIAGLLKIPVEGLVGADTEIGRFLRTRNAVVKIGDFVFVHAGISPPLVAGKLRIGQLNSVMRSALGVPPDKIENRGVAAILWGPLGPLWYRGYFKEWAIHFGPTPSVEQVDEILEKLDAKTIVIGHTKVDAVKDLYGKRRVLAIDVPWTRPDDVRGLSVKRRDGGVEIHVVDRRGKRVALR